MAVRSREAARGQGKKNCLVEEFAGRRIVELFWKATKKQAAGMEGEREKRTGRE